MLFDDDFLLESDVARDLYERYAKGRPIIDYHCHLPPEQIESDHRFRSLTSIWLDGDHYKWRAMRSNGVGEDYCTGKKSDWEKFEAWAATVPKTLRNPLYHWTHLELKFPFGIRRLLGPTTAREIFDRGSELLQGAGFSTRGLLRQFNVLAVCTTDDPADSLEHHAAYAQKVQAAETRMYPTFRPDRALDVDQPDTLNAWLERLEARVGTSVSSFEQLLSALDARHRAFHELGGRLSDHGLETAYADDYSLPEVRETFAAARSGTAADAGRTARFRSALLHELALMDHGRGWVQQFHLGALRNNNTRMRRSLGPDTGFDSIGDFELARPLARFLDRLDSDNRLAKTILYNLNPRDNELMATMVGNFQDGSVPGKLQYGSAWWFLDQLDGMEKQICALSQMGLLARFVGMLTDSRSFLSYSRHDYFRRLLCNILGQDVRRGLLPDDRELLGEMVTDICFRNARAYFGLAIPQH
jgi:glucuronate isomerase